MDPIEWSEARRETGQSTPNIQLILDYAFNAAQACVVLITPDEEVQLRAEYRTGKDKQVESEIGGQARPNVLWEGGMAYGRSPQKTVIVEMGPLRPFTDIAGLHTIRMDGSPEQIIMFGDSLKSAGCPVKREGVDWLSAADWKSVIAALPENNDHFNTDQKNDKQEEPSLHLSAEVRPSTTGTSIGMENSVDAEVSVVNHSTNPINIKEVGLQIDGEDVPFPFESGGTGGHIPDNISAQDSFRVSRILYKKHTIEKIRSHDEINIYMIDGTLKRTLGIVTVHPSIT